MTKVPALPEYMSRSLGCLLNNTLGLDTCARYFETWYPDNHVCRTERETLLHYRSACLLALECGGRPEGRGPLATRVVIEF